MCWSGPATSYPASRPIPRGCEDCDDRELAHFAAAGIDADALARKLQDDGASAFVQSWNDLLRVIGSKCAALGRAAP